MANPYSVTQSAQGVLSTNKVLKNTFLLLSTTLGFSAVTATLSMALQMPSWVYLVSVIGAMVLGIFVLPQSGKSSKGVGVIFLITGMLGFGLGAILSMYLALPNGGRDRRHRFRRYRGDLPRSVRLRPDPQATSPSWADSCSPA